MEIFADQQFDDLIELIPFGYMYMDWSDKMIVMICVG